MSYDYPERGVDMRYGLLDDRFFDINTATLQWSVNMRYSGSIIIGLRYGLLLPCNGSVNRTS